MTPEVILHRIAYKPYATYGILMENEQPWMLTLEDPWNNNAPFKSCIPIGHYHCRRINSPKFGDTFEVVNVPGRSHILFHAGNTWEDTEGCILLGSRWDQVDGKTVIRDSRAALLKFMERMRGYDAFNLNIRRPT